MVFVLRAVNNFLCWPTVPRRSFAPQIPIDCDTPHRIVFGRVISLPECPSLLNFCKEEALYEIETRHVIVKAVQHIRRMRGGSQSHLMRCSNGKFYVVKFRNNPQSVRVLANEFIVANLARQIGLNVPCPAIVEVDPWLVNNSPELDIRLFQEEPIPCEPGLQFGSEYAIDPRIGRLWDWLPQELLTRIRNRSEFAGILVLDKWLCNADNRQVVFWRRCVEKKYTASFIDHGYCFRCGEWTFEDQVLRGAFPRNEVYEHITGWDAFDPWLSDVENMDEDLIWSAVAPTPPSWYKDDSSAVEKLVGELFRRRHKVRSLIEAFKDSERHPFPHWGHRDVSWWVEPDWEPGRKIAAGAG